MNNKINQIENRAASVQGPAQEVPTQMGTALTSMSHALQGAAIGELFSDVKFDGQLNERALLIHWRDGVEALLQELPALESSMRGPKLLCDRLSNLWRAVSPQRVTSENVESLLIGFDRTLGPLDVTRDLTVVPEELAGQRAALFSMANRIGHFQLHVSPSMIDPNWNYMYRQALLILSASATALGTAGEIEKVLTRPHHSLFGAALSVCREIARETQRYEGALPTSSDLSPAQANIVRMRNRLVGHLVQASLELQKTHNAKSVFECMQTFGADAAPAFEYLLSGNELNCRTATLLGFYFPVSS